MKKLISMLLAIAIIMCVALTVAAAEAQTNAPASNGLIEDGKVEFDDLIGAGSAEDVTITGTTDKIDHTVEGQVITVDHEEACKVAYLSGDKYVTIAAVANADGTYSFTVPEGVTEAILVVTGDMNMDGVVDMEDTTKMMRHALNAETITDGKALVAAEVTENDSVDMEDVAKLMRYVLKAIDSLA